LTTGRTASNTAPSSHRRFQLRHELEQVADQADVGDFEDRRLGVLVDRDDGAGVLDDAC
jgi:hypothetical protein